MTILPNLYEELRDSDKQRLAIPGGELLRVPVALGECVVEDEIGARPFGTSVDDFKRLCRNAAWDYPNGLVLFNLDRARSLIFPADTFFEPQAANLEHALDYLQRVPGTFGMTVKAKGGMAHCDLCSLLFHDEEGDGALLSRAENLMALVKSWE